MNKISLKETVCHSLQKRKIAKLDIVKLLKEKAGIGIPSKQKAKEYLMKNLKSEKDVDEAYRFIPKILNFLKKSYITADEKVYPPGFLKNMLILIALVAMGEGMFPTSATEAKKILIEEKIIKKNFEQLGYISKEKLDKIIEYSDNIVDIKLKILKTLTRDKESLGYIGKSIPKNFSVDKIELTGKSFGELINSPKKLKKIKNMVYINKKMN